ncbi:MAG: hypothetical protein HY331_16055 [Chloroflexi bacterium]|nr:hypothetical protein [Chloroflexota bacterium]
MINRLTRIVLPGLLLALLAVGCQSLSVSPPDRKLAPAGTGPATSLAVDPADGSLLKAGGGLARSLDQGQSWKPLSVPSALHPDRIRQIATSSAAPASIFAGGPGAGIVRSDDAGQSWRAVGAGLPSQEVGAFAVHSSRSDTLYAWIAGQGVFRTEDGGGRWEKMDLGPSASVAMLAHSPLEGSMNTGWLYGAASEGVYLSMDCF